MKHTFAGVLGAVSPSLQLHIDSADVTVTSFEGKLWTPYDEVRQFRRTERVTANTLRLLLVFSPAGLHADFYMAYWTFEGELRTIGPTRRKRRSVGPWVHTRYAIELPMTFNRLTFEEAPLTLPKTYTRTQDVLVNRDETGDHYTSYTLTATIEVSPAAEAAYSTMRDEAYERGWVK